MPSKKQIADYWADKLDIEGVEHCFQCGSQCLIQRAHILSRFKGGGDEPSNLHLLCRSCHQESEYLYGAGYDEWFNGPNRAYVRAHGMFLVALETGNLSHIKHLVVKDTYKELERMLPKALEEWRQKHNEKIK